MNMETWKPIPNFALYEVSDLGRVKRIAYTSTDSEGRKYSYPEKIVKQSLRDKRYFSVPLRKNKKNSNFRVHNLVMLAFMGESKLTIDHIDNNSQNNRLDNLRYITHRRNVLYGKSDKNRKHKYPGIWLKPNGKYGASMQLNGKTKHLGTYTDPKEASQAYINAIQNL